MELMIASALMMGLFSTPHCVGMCGGLVAAMTYRLNQASPLAAFWAVFQLNLARVLSYSLLGILVGIVGASAAHYMPMLVVPMRLLAGMLLILSGLYIAKWWLGLRHLENLGMGLWQKANKRLMSLNAKKAKGAPILTGMAWGCLPCGLVYSALTMAMTQGSVFNSAVFMAAFGIGTLPVLVMVAMISNNLRLWLQQQWVASGVGASLILYGLWTIWMVMV